MFQNSKCKVPQILQIIPHSVLKVLKRKESGCEGGGLADTVRRGDGGVFAFNLLWVVTFPFFFFFFGHMTYVRTVVLEHAFISSCCC